MHLGVERDADRQRRKEENRQLLEEQMALQKQLEERDRQETAKSSVSRWQSTSLVVLQDELESQVQKVELLHHLHHTAQATATIPKHWS